MFHTNACPESHPCKQICWYDEVCWKENNSNYDFCRTNCDCTGGTANECYPPRMLMAQQRSELTQVPRVTVFSYDNVLISLLAIFGAIIIFALYRTFRTR